MTKNKLKIFLIAASLVSLIPAGFASYKYGLWRVHYLSPDEFPVQGLDVSHHQGDIRWDEVPKSFSFVYIKATEGGDFKDKKFAYNWREAKASGFKTGAYHFFTLCRPGRDQAKNFIETVPVEAGTMPPVIDLEFVGNCSKRPQKETLVRDLKEYADDMKRHYQVKPVLYTTYDFFETYLKDTEFSEYPIWIRDIWNRPQKRFPSWHIWQYADNARIDGIDTPVDLNVMNK